MPKLSLSQHDVIDLVFWYWKAGIRNPESAELRARLFALVPSVECHCGEFNPISYARVAKGKAICFACRDLIVFSEDDVTPAADDRDTVEQTAKVDVHAALQPLEEIWGPELPEYIEVMESIKAEIETRIANAKAQLKEKR